MGHMVAKDVYRKLGSKIDGLTARVPWNETLRSILKELYTTDEADFVARMPYGLAGLDQIVRVTGYEKERARRLLESLADKGLVLDIGVKGRYLYTISPLIIGIFEFTMMRTRGELNHKEWARLFHDYLSDPDTFYRANCGSGKTVSPLRAIPHEGTVADEDYLEVLNYEKAVAITESADLFAVGICSCRHEKLHHGSKKCDVPLELCSSYGAAAEHLTRHGFAREISKSEMLENLAASRERRLVFCADNVKKNISFICHCCGCCCNALAGISQFGYPNMVVSSNYIARSDPEACSGCGDCADNCPVNAITMSEEEDPIVDEEMCLGCGVCVLDCTTESLRLVPRAQRVFTPEDTFERVISQALQQGTLQNLVFNNPQSNSQAFMRGLVGGFLKLPPVKKSLMSDTLRSRFLTFMRRG